MAKDFFEGELYTNLQKNHPFAKKLCPFKTLSMNQRFLCISCLYIYIQSSFRLNMSRIFYSFASDSLKHCVWQISFLKYRVFVRYCVCLMQSSPFDRQSHASVIMAAPLGRSKHFLKKKKITAFLTHPVVTLLFPGLFRSDKRAWKKHFSQKSKPSRH